jgi:DNA-3-methyladenine glycosylase
VDLSLNGADLLQAPFELSGRTDGWKSVGVVTSERIGITKAAELPWRYCAAGSRYVSKPLPAALREDRQAA